MFDLSLRTTAYAAGATIAAHVITYGCCKINTQTKNDIVSRISFVATFASIILGMATASLAVVGVGAFLGRHLVSSGCNAKFSAIIGLTLMGVASTGNILGLYFLLDKAVK